MLNVENHEMIQKWLGIQNLNAHLLYNARKDGDTFDDVWPKIQGKCNLLFLLRSHNYRTFGGFASLQLKKDKSIKDIKSFAF